MIAYKSAQLMTGFLVAEWIICITMKMHMQSYQFEVGDTANFFNRPLCFIAIYREPKAAVSKVPDSAAYSNSNLKLFAI